ncbi:uncharacterized protein [Nicotiana sylvestris]|uniref:uncharacterized protein n=1 Tax=Nicotiana sylvestris TaxID=4096 RepID=UPI00388CAC04
MASAPTATPPAQSAQGRAQSTRGHPRGGGRFGGGQAHFYALPARPNSITSEAVITDIISTVCIGRVTIGGLETRVDLLLLSMVDFDVILGMDLCFPHHAILDYYAKAVTLAILGLPQIEWQGSLDYVPSRVISLLKSQRMVRKGCLSYLAVVRDVSAETPTIDSVPVVQDFLHVFPVELPGMLPDIDINFGIDLVPGTQPISIPPYRMAPTKFKDLKEQLQELLD